MGRWETSIVLIRFCTMVTLLSFLRRNSLLLGGRLPSKDMEVLALPTPTQEVVGRPKLGDHWDLESNCLYRSYCSLDHLI